MHSIRQESLTEPSTTQGVMTPAWIVCAWPPILWQAESEPGLQLVHLGTCVLSTSDGKHPCTGQTLWGEANPDRATGVAWDWVEVLDGVVAMSDPLGVVTNLRLLDCHGEVMTQTQVAMQLNQLVHALPWQTEVQRALERAI